MSNWLQPHSVLDWGGSDANMLKESEKIFTQIQNSNTYLPKKCLLQPHSVMDWGGGDANMHKESGKIRQLDAIQDFADLPSAYKRRKRQICATSMNHRHA